MLRIEHHETHLAELRAAALAAVEPGAAVRRALTEADVAAARRVWVVGAGKAGVAMAQAAAEIVGARLAGGVLAVPEPPTDETRIAGPARPWTTSARLAGSADGLIHFVQGGHPLPDVGSLAAGATVAAMLAQATSEDLVLALISGGGSALLELPVPGVSLEALQALTQTLLRSGAAIDEINVIRRRLSQIKGGGLARLAGPAPVLGLILSDVIGNRLDIIASGPTVASEDRPDEARAIAERYGLWSALPVDIQTALDAPRSAGAPRPRVENRLIGSNKLAALAALDQARRLGFPATWVGDEWRGEARAAARRFVDMLAQTPGPHAWIGGGETTVTVCGRGRGGRNQEFALAAALALEGCAGCVVSSFGTDGVDGPTDAAGATVNDQTCARARALGLDPQAYLDDNNAHAFFGALGGLIRTGPTGTNVNDLMFGLRYGR
jgi:hydroxypyruvate reductase